MTRYSYCVAEGTEENPLSLLRVLTIAATSICRAAHTVTGPRWRPTYGAFPAGENMDMDEDGNLLGMFS